MLNLEHQNRLVRYQICFKIVLTNKTDKVVWLLVLLKKKKKKPKLHFIQILLTVEIITNNEQRTTDKLRKRKREWQLSLHSCSSSPALLILHLLVLVALNWNLHVAKSQPSVALICGTMMMMIMISRKHKWREATVSRFAVYAEEGVLLKQQRQPQRLWLCSLFAPPMLPIYTPMIIWYTSIFFFPKHFFFFFFKLRFYFMLIDRI